MRPPRVQGTPAPHRARAAALQVAAAAHCPDPRQEGRGSTPSVSDSVDGLLLRERASLPGSRGWSTTTRGATHRRIRLCRCSTTLCSAPSTLHPVPCALCPERALHPAPYLCGLRYVGCAHCTLLLVQVLNHGVYEPDDARRGGARFSYLSGTHLLAHVIHQTTGLPPQQCANPGTAPCITPPTHGTPVSKRSLEKTHVAWPARLTRIWSPSQHSSPHSSLPVPPRVLRYLRARPR